MLILSTLKVDYLKYFETLILAKTSTAFKQLPPNKFARETRDGRTFYVYPDPMVCGCLYVGDQRAYGTYNFNLLQKNMADQQQAAADALMATWDWGPWGGYPDGWYY